MQSKEIKVSSIRLEKPMRITEQVWPEGTMPLVSICCITYNHENFIRDAIEGFLMQETTFPVEIFIHDDASTDSTAEIIKEYADQYPKLFWTVLQKDNQWSKGNRRILLDYHAKQRGEFIALCEGDDYWIAKNKLQNQVEILLKDPSISLVFHNAWAKHMDSHRDFFLNNGIDKKKFSLVEIIEREWFIATASIVHRKLEAIPINIANFAIAADRLIHIFACLRGDAFYYDSVCSVYRIHDQSISASWKNSETKEWEELYPNMCWMYWLLRCETLPNNTHIVTDKLISSYINQIASFVTKSGSLPFLRFQYHLEKQAQKIFRNSRPAFIDEMSTTYKSLSLIIQKECARFVIRIPIQWIRKKAHPILNSFRKWIRKL